MKFFHKSETPKLNTKFFSDDKEKIKNILKTLIITSGSRNGNHLVWSLLDGNKKIPFIPGEDRLLSQIFIRNLKNQKKFQFELKKKKSNFLRKLSGMRFDKWQKLHKKKINLKKWAGKQEQKDIPILEFPNIIHKVNYENYRNEIKNEFKKLKKINFFQVFRIYLNAVKKLSPNKKDTLYQYSYAQSGLRRELLYLLNNNANLKVVVPIRRFETFYFSKTMGFFNSVKITKRYINWAWDHWYHKTNDYIFLKKKFPKNIIFVIFEDLENISTRKKAMKKLLKKLNLRFEKINLIPTIFKNKVLPNSSFFVRRNKSFNIRKIDKNLVFPKNKIPKKYYSIFKIVKKLSY